MTISGKWVQTTHGLTPLGVIFHNTNLNHLGYSLDRDSVSMCKDVPEENLEKCFREKENWRRFAWAKRDFTVNVDDMLRYIGDFVLYNRDEVRTCDDLTGALNERFVLYNVWCKKRRVWYPTMRNNKHSCLYGSDYPQFFENSKDPGLFFFDSWKDCCDAHLESCDSQVRVGGESTLLPPIPSSAVSLFHAYKRHP